MTNLYHYIKDDTALIACIDSLFGTIITLSGNIFADYDSELISEMSYEYYYQKRLFPLKKLYEVYSENAVDWTDDDSVKGFFAHIAKVAYARYGENWEKIYNAYFVLTYNPLENYDMEQVRTPNLTTDTDIDRKQDTKVETGAKTKVVPFNASTSTLTGETTGDSETTEELAKNHIDQATTETGTDTLTRHGNIGVTTSQQMLQSELDLRKLDFQKRIFEDISRVMLRNYLPSC